MIELNEVVEELANCETEYGFNPDDVLNILTKAYTSRGTCFDCDRWTQINIGFGTCFFVEVPDMIYHKTDFCSKFQRKQ